MADSNELSEMRALSCIRGTTADVSARAEAKIWITKQVVGRGRWGVWARTWRRAREERNRSNT